MKKHVAAICVCVLLLAASQQCLAQKNLKPSDTAGTADIESRLEDFKTIAGAMTNGITNCGSLDSVKRFAAIMQSVDDTILNHISPIFDGFSVVHPDQYEPLKNMNDLVDRILSTKDLVKAKKNNDKIIIEYNNLVKAK